MRDDIIVTGAREHNLRGIDVRIPRGRLTVVTGLSGSGKSTLAFDTLYAEGQRRYVESLSSYARRFLDQLPKPAVDRIDGLAPAIAIEQRTSGANPRSTVATVTEIHDYLRLLFAAVGQPHCPDCGRPVRRYTAEQITDRLLALPPGTRITLLAPWRGRARGVPGMLDDVRRRGFTRVRLDGVVADVDEAPQGPAKARAIVVDRLEAGPDRRGRLADSVELALREGEGVLLAAMALPDGTAREDRYAERMDCPVCDRQFDILTPAHFSFNSPHGACPACHGLGVEDAFDEALIAPDRSLPLDRAIAPWQRGARRSVQRFRRQLRALAQQAGWDAKTPLKDLPAALVREVFHGVARDDAARETNGLQAAAAANRRPRGYEGVIPNLARRLRETESDYVRDVLRRYTVRRPCSVCGGARLQPASLACTVGGRSMAALSAMTARDAGVFLAGLRLPGARAERVQEVVREACLRLGFLVDVGLDYLTLDRASATLSGGEAQRIRLAGQLGAGLSGVLYVLDEPTIGLHTRDTERLMAALFRLRDAGNTLVVVEHDAAVIRAADHVIDLGPGAGRHGGRVLFEGDVPALLRETHSPTAAYLRGTQDGALPTPARRPPGTAALRIEGATGNNLRNVTVHIPLGRLVCVSGVSGSGKSTLVDDTLRRALARRLHGAREAPAPHRALHGAEAIDRLVVVDAAPIGRTPRSNPATYADVLPPIRDFFARVPLARARGYAPGRFSFNLKGGRCEHCRGDGSLRIDMQFLPDVFVTCEACGGARYNRETLDVRVRGRHIADVLAMTVDEALDFFAAVPRVARRLRVLSEVGLGYLQLGQPAPTLSGGEAQRLKLASELARQATGRTLVMLDEPTTGLHVVDVERLMDVLERLREGGNTVLVVEHHLEVLRRADWIVDLGPEGGEEGGRLVAEGPPEAIAACAASHTGRALREQAGIRPAPATEGVP